MKIVIALLVLLIAVLILSGFDMHEYPCGHHFNNGYYRTCN